ncbi:MAG TPA: glycosyltransferase family 39 protein [Acidobacteriaceae bacterium]|nr:glycosyltransferase family 39 protein [Acidobacteriaceae bacterium]
MRLTFPSLKNPERPLPLWMLFPPIFVFVYLTHITLLRLPYFWDEAGYYIPAAYDYFRTGTLIPQSTLSNAHPPLPSILLAAWWHLRGFTPISTRTLVCVIASFALLAVYRIARPVCGDLGAAAVTLLTALYPIWFAQSTLAHADIFAASFTLWGIWLYLDDANEPHPQRLPAMALLFWLAVLSKETALITPLLLALIELRHRRYGSTAALLSPILPLAAWFTYHRHVTGYAFGNPQYLRYNATANFGLQRIGFALFHRAIHLTAHMNLFVPALCALACLFLAPLPERRPLPRSILITLGTLLTGYWIFFSIFGGALLTRYLLPGYPLVILLCVATWQRHLRQWWPLAAFSAAAFVAGIFINPPYHFAPEDNLAYRDMIVLQQNATAAILQRWPQTTVLTAWPVTDELRKPELGYVRTPMKVVSIDNFSLPQLQQAAAEEDAFDTALIFSTKYDPPSLRGRNVTMETQYFDFHRDLFPAQTAAILHGSIVWQEERNGQWAAVVRLDKGSLAQLREAGGATIINR